MVAAKKTSTLCIDARLWGTKHTGIGRYVENLIANLPEDPLVKIVLIVPPDLKNEPKLASFKKYYAKYHPYTVLSLFEMLFILIHIQPDLLHVPHLTVPFLWPGKMIVTIHDLIKHYNPSPASSTKPSLIYWLKYLEYLLVFRMALLRSAHIIVPAKYWKEVLNRDYNVPLKKISVTYEGVSKSLTSLPKSQIDIPDKPYVFYVGNVYPHKNIPTLLAAIKKFDGRVLLIIACARSVFSQRLEKMIQDQGIQKWVKFLGFVSDVDLKALYENALAFTFPTFIEGFGLPGLEAMNFGCPVISSNSSCLPEVYGNAALYFSPHSPDDLADKIDTLILNPGLRTTLIARGKKQAGKYSWVKMGRQTWAIYQNQLH